MIWYFIEFIFLINLFLVVAPIKLITKKYWILFTYIALTGCLLFFFFNNNIDFIFCLIENYYFTLYFLIDELSIIFCVLTALLAVLIILTNWKNPTYNSNVYFFIILILTFSLFHAFTSLNLFSFYIFFEITLIPMFIMIIIWGGRQRKFHAAYVFFFYTALGSIFLLFGLLYLYALTGSTNLLVLNYLSLDNTTQYLLWGFFFTGFATKVPLVPFHTWLPEAHVEAPTSGSILLAGLLLKIGTFGMLKFMFPILNEATSYFRGLTFLLALLSIYHASLIALRQIDLKKIIAYSSIAHMGFVILGLFSANLFGLLGAVFIMFSHGVVASCLFFLIEILYSRYKSKNLLDYGGLANLMPLYSIFFFFFILANLSFPGTSNFIGEITVLFGLIEVNFFATFVAVFSIILTASYSIWTFNRLFFGILSKRLVGFSDLNKIEFSIISIFFFFMILFGFFPNLIFSKLELNLFNYLMMRV